MRSTGCPHKVTVYTMGQIKSNCKDHLSECYHKNVVPLPEKSRREMGVMGTDYVQEMTEYVTNMALTHKALTPNAIFKDAVEHFKGIDRNYTKEKSRV